MTRRKPTTRPTVVEPPPPPPPPAPAPLEEEEPRKDTNRETLAVAGVTGTLATGIVILLDRVFDFRIDIGLATALAAGLVTFVVFVSHEGILGLWNRIWRGKEEEES